MAKITAGSKLATRTVLPHTKLMPTQKISTEPTIERFQRAASLISGCTITVTTILGYTAMAGYVGGGGLGSIALMRGHARNQRLVLYVAVIILVILVQIIQTIGTRLTIKTDKRINK